MCPNAMIRSASASAPSCGWRYRAAILDRLNYWKGAVEGDEKFNSFRSPATLKTARLEAGKRGVTFTTCIEFMGHVQDEAL